MQKQFRTVLLVEDNSECRMEIATLLEGFGFEVESITGAREALTRIENGNNIDLIITDMKMEGMSGLTLARKVRHIYPVLLLSSSDSDIQRARDARHFALNKQELQEDPSLLMDQIHAVSEAFGYQQTLQQTEKTTKEIQINFTKFKIENDQKLQEITEYQTSQGVQLSKVITILEKKEFNLLTSGCANVPVCDPATVSSPTSTQPNSQPSPGSAAWGDVVLSNIKKSPIMMLVWTLLVIIAINYAYNPFGSKKSSPSRAPSSIKSTKSITQQPIRMKVGTGDNSTEVIIPVKR